jgi:hypothetical protein
LFWERGAGECCCDSALRKRARADRELFLALAIRRNGLMAQSRVLAMRSQLGKRKRNNYLQLYTRADPDLKMSEHTRAEVEHAPSRCGHTTMGPTVYMSVFGTERLPARLAWSEAEHVVSNYNYNCHYRSKAWPTIRPCLIMQPR